MTRKSMNRAHFTAATLILTSLLGAAGCRDTGLAPPRTAARDAAPADPSLIASVTLADGARVEFIGIGENVFVWAEVQAAQRNPLADWSVEGSSLVTLYERLAGSSAPRALVDAEQHLQARAVREPRFGTAGPTVEPQLARGTSPTLSMTGPTFVDRYCDEDGYCWTDRVSYASITRLGQWAASLAVHCVSGKVTVEFAERGWFQPWKIILCRDVAPDATAYFVQLYLLPTDIRLQVTPRPTARYHLAFS